MTDKVNAVGDFRNSADERRDTGVVYRKFTDISGKAGKDNNITA